MSRTAQFLALAAAAGLVFLLAWYWPHVRNEFFVLLGNRNEAGGWYGFNSGPAGAFYMSVVPAGLLLYWHSTCHIGRCLRHGRHDVDGTRWCNRHHLDARRKLAATGSAHDLGAQ